MVETPTLPKVRSTQKEADSILAVREQAHPGSLADFSVFFQLLMTYRMPMKVQDAIVFRRFPHDHLFYRCPRCQELLERDFMAYCNHCGQYLDWHDYKQVRWSYFQPK